MANRWGIPKAVEIAVRARDTQCVYCGAEFGTNRTTSKSWEHIINDVHIATLNNIALCCVGCNASKGAKRLKDWLDSPHAKRRGITAKTLSPLVMLALSEHLIGAEKTLSDDPIH